MRRLYPCAPVPLYPFGVIASGEGVRARGTGIAGEGVKGYRQSLPILFTPYPFGVRTEDASPRAKGYATKGLPDGLPKDYRR